MAVVKGSQQESLVITQYRPWKKVRRWFFSLLMLVVVGAGGYFVGWYDSWTSTSRLSIERDQLRHELHRAERTISSLTQRVGILEKGGEVDRQATEGIRHTVVELKYQISTLEEEVAFYKGIMAPSSSDMGLRVSKIDLTAQENGSVRYSIMLTQVADNSSFIAGLAAVNFVGSRNEERVILPLRDLDRSIDDLGVRFRFRYFQEISGELVVPEGFTPEQVQVVLQSTGSKAQRVEKSIEWLQ